MKISNNQNNKILNLKNIKILKYHNNNKYFYKTYINNK